VRVAVTLRGWQLVVMLNYIEPQREYPELKLPTEDELKAMAKVVYRKFYKAKRNGVP